MEKLNFENKEIDIQELPKLEDLKFNRVEKKYLWVLLSRTILFILIFTISGICFHYLGKTGFEFEYILYALIAINGLALIRVLMLLISFKVRAYALRENDISYQKGLLFFKQTTVSVNRIQHVELTQSFLMKLFDLAAIKIYTAGGSQSDISIAGLSKSKGEEIKNLLTEKLSKHE